jgi:hypothetical protein
MSRKVTNKKPTKPVNKARPLSKQAAAMAQQVQQNKKILLDALEKSLGVVTLACKSAQLNRTTFYNYVNSDPEFAAAVKDVDNVALDFAESQLHKQIGAGVPSSTIFYLKTRGKERGYVETSIHEHSGPGGNPIEQKFIVEVVSDSSDSGTKNTNK